MLEDASYREWTAAFNPGSYYKGSWEQGSKIQFLGPDPEGKSEEGGMFAEIAENRPHEFVSIKMLGEIRDGVETPYGEDAEGYENYTFVDKDGSTELLIDLKGIPDEYVEMFEDMWPRALEKLKEIIER